MNKKLISIFVIGLFLFSFVFGFYTPKVKAYSAETTGLSTYGFDNSQQTYCYVNGFNIFAFDNKLVFYDNNSVLIKTYDIPAFGLISGYFHDNNLTVTRIISIGDNTNILIAVITVGEGGGSGDYTVIQWHYGLLNVNTLGYTSISDTYVTYSDTGSYENYGFGSVGLSSVLIKNSNSTGSFFYIWYSYDYKVSGNYPHENKGNVFAYLGKINTSFVWSSGYAVKLSSTTNIWIYSNALFLGYDYGVPVNTAYVVCSNNFQGGLRAYIYAFDFSSATITLTYVGLTTLDYTYCGSYVDGSALYSGFVYLLGCGIYDNTICVNVAFNTALGQDMSVGTIMFNSSYIGQSIVNMGLSSNSYVIRPFTVGLPNNQGNISGVYSIGYFDDIFGHTANGLMWVDANGRYIVDFNGYYYATETGHISWDILGHYWTNATGTFTLHYITVNDVYTGSWDLTGWSLTCIGLSEGAPNPVWTTYQFGFQFTPQQPQSFPYTTSWDWGGFQPLNCGIGLFVDMVRYLKCEANTMYNINTGFIFNGVLNGGIFNNVVIATSPTQITLQIGVDYTYTGNTYINTILTGNGNFTIYVSALSTSPNIFTSPSLTQAVTGNIVNGQFQFTLSGVTATNTVYRVIEVDYNSSNYIGFVTYNLGFYGYGSSPYPTQPNNGGGGGIINGGGVVNPFQGFGVGNSEFAVIIYIICIIGVIAGFFYLYNSNIPFAIGLGLIIATVICDVLNILGVYTLPINALIIICGVLILVFMRHN